MRRRKISMLWRQKKTPLFLLQRMAGSCSPSAFAARFARGMRQDLETSRKLGVLSGDSQKTAERVGRELRLDKVR